MFVMIRHKVHDYDAWKLVFDEHEDERQAAGSKGAHLFRSADDPNEVVITLTWDDARVDDARAFAASDDLRTVMQEAGVIDQPDIYFLNDAGRTTG
jgi:heme-degrading monooxygenase HmoA